MCFSSPELCDDDCSNPSRLRRVGGDPQTEVSRGPPESPRIERLILGITLAPTRGFSGAGGI